MQNDLVFRSGLIRRVVGWVVCLFCVGALVAMIYGILTHPESHVASELWSGAIIGVFLVGLFIGGISIQYAYWSIEGDEIIHRRLFRKKVIPISQLGGFGSTIMMVNLVPLTQIDLYDSAPKPITRLPVSIKDWPRAEAWLATRLRYVVNDGSPALPKFRFVDAAKM